MTNYTVSTLAPKYSLAFEWIGRQLSYWVCKLGRVASLKFAEKALSANVLPGEEAGQACCIFTVQIYFRFLCGVHDCRWYQCIFGMPADTTMICQMNIYLHQWDRSAIAPHSSVPTPMGGRSYLLLC